jgi:hypothetical protein
MKTRLLHWVAKMLGVLIKIDGIPYGAATKIGSSATQYTYPSSQRPSAS